MKRLFFSVLILAAITTMSFAQGKLVMDNDPEAAAILKEVKAKYESYKEMSADFELVISYPEQENVIQGGRLVRQGAMYYLKMEQYEVFCNGQSIAMVLHNVKEVQITDMPDADEEENLLTPQSVFNFYESGKYTYLLRDNISEKGRILHQIEFKPLDRDSDYFKIRLTIDKKTKEIVRVKAFSADGSRYTFILGNTKIDQVHGKDYFTFQPKKFPDYYVEDLRE